LLLGTFIFRGLIFKLPINFIKLIIILLVIIYISEESGNLFSQFNIWILPFIALVALYDPFYTLFFIAPILGYFKRIHIDSSLLTGSLSLSLGPHLTNVPDYRTLLQNVIESSLISLLIQSLMVV